MTEQSNQDQPVTTKTIPMQGATLRFYQGVGAGDRILKEHAEVAFPDEETRLRAYLFYGGALAAGEHGCTTSEDFSNFMLGLATRAPDPNKGIPQSLNDRLYNFEARAAEDELKIDLELICTQCEEHVCDVEHEDTLDVLVRTALGHTCS